MVPPEIERGGVGVLSFGDRDEHHGRDGQPAPVLLQVLCEGVHPRIAPGARQIYPGKSGGKPEEVLQGEARRHPLRLGTAPQALLFPQGEVPNH